MCLKKLKKHAIAVDVSNMIHIVINVANVVDVIDFLSYFLV